MHLIKSHRLKVKGNQLLGQGIFGGQSREAQPDPWLFREAGLGRALCLAELAEATAVPGSRSPPGPSCCCHLRARFFRNSGSGELGKIQIFLMGSAFSHSLGFH